jgi:hypothetical protein
MSAAFLKVDVEEKGKGGGFIRFELVFLCFLRLSL